MLGFIFSFGFSLVSLWSSSSSFWNLWCIGTLLLTKTLIVIALMYKTYIPNMSCVHCEWAVQWKHVWISSQVDGEQQQQQQLQQQRWQRRPLKMYVVGCCFHRFQFNTKDRLRNISKNRTQIEIHRSCCVVSSKDFSKLSIQFEFGTSTIGWITLVVDQPIFLFRFKDVNELKRKHTTFWKRQTNQHKVNNVLFLLSFNANSCLLKEYRFAVELLLTAAYRCLRSHRSFTMFTLWL